MEFFYPNNFIRFYNDEERDEVGEYEILTDGPFTPSFSSVNDLPQSRYLGDDQFYNDDQSYENDDLFRENTETDPQSNNMENAQQYDYMPNKNQPYPQYTPGKNKQTPSYMPNVISDFPNNLMQTFPINLAASFIPTGQFGGQGAAPMGPPPSYIPSKNDKNVQSLGKNLPPAGPGTPQTKAVSGGSIKPCLYRYTYIWQTNGRSYWAYITRVDPRSISGWRWLGFRWVYFGVDTRKIDYFVCY